MKIINLIFMAAFLSGRVFAASQPLGAGGVEVMKASEGRSTNGNHYGTIFQGVGALEYYGLDPALALALVRTNSGELAIQAYSDKGADTTTNSQWYLEMHPTTIDNLLQVRNGTGPHVDWVQSMTTALYREYVLTNNVTVYENSNGNIYAQSVLLPGGPVTSANNPTFTGTAHNYPSIYTNYIGGSWQEYKTTTAWGIYNTDANQTMFELGEDFNGNGYVIFRPLGSQSTTNFGDFYANGVFSGGTNLHDLIAVNTASIASKQNGSATLTNLASTGSNNVTKVNVQSGTANNLMGTNAQFTSAKASTLPSVTFSNAAGSAARKWEARDTNGALQAFLGSNGNFVVVGNYTDDSNWGGVMFSASNGVIRMTSTTRGTGTNQPIDFSANSGVLSQLRINTNGDLVAIGNLTLTGGQTNTGALRAASFTTPGTISAGGAIGNTAGGVNSFFNDLITTGGSIGLSGSGNVGWNGKSQIKSSANGFFELFTSDGNNFVNLKATNFQGNSGWFTNGIATYSTNATVTVGTTGVTNTLGVNAMVAEFAGVSVTQTHADGTTVSRGTISAGIDIILQPGAKLTGTSCSASGNLRAF